MKYDVYLGDLTIYGVTDVAEQSGRGLDVYDGLGQGNYPVAKSKDLRTWDVSCEFTENNDRGLSDWTAARRMFKQFESILDSKTSRRLVITSDYGKISIPALLESYTKTEKFSGVYDVRIKFTEYKASEKKTTNVPYVARPGKVPVEPVVVFKSSTQVAGAAISRQTADMLMARDEWARKQQVYFYTDENGVERSTTNPNMVPVNKKVTVTPKSIFDPLEWTETSFPKSSIPQSFAPTPAYTPWNETDIKTSGKGVIMTFNAIGNALEKFNEDMKAHPFVVVKK